MLMLSPLRMWAFPWEQHEEISISDAPISPVQAPIRGFNCVLPLSFVVFLPRWAVLMLLRPVIEKGGGASVCEHTKMLIGSSFPQQSQFTAQAHCSPLSWTPSKNSSGAASPVEIAVSPPSPPSLR